MMNQQLPAYDVHPTSLRLMKKGHPWIIEDQYTEKFHPRDRFIVATERRRPCALFIHDPRHSSIKARIWAQKGDFSRLIKSFKNDLMVRMQKAINKRKQKELLKDRENFYLIFGEADQLPGLHVQYLNGEILVQFYTYFWDNYSDYVITNLQKALSNVFNMEITKSEFWIQHRADSGVSKQPAKSLNPNVSFKKIDICEYDVNYEIEIGRNYDCGLYTDMSSVRGHLMQEFKAAKSVLNLFSYTGAFTCFSLKHGADRAVSVDLSEKYLEQLEYNISLNKDLKTKEHTSLRLPTQEALDKLLGEKQTFSLVICDPPSSSSDGNKRTNALKEYESMLPKMYELLEKDGKVLIFLNTHKVSRVKFEQKITEILKNKKIPLIIQKKVGLAADCPTIKGFPEGSYLKGLLLCHDKGQ